MRNKDLKPCPFCGSEEIHIIGNKNYWIVCNGCGAEGPATSELHKSEEKAIEAWNMRAYE